MEVMVKGQLRVLVDRPAEEVFDFLADIRNEVAWNPRVLGIEKATTGPIGPGTTFEGRYRGLEVLRTELTEYQRPRRLSFRSDGPRMRIAGTYVLAPAVGGTEIALEAELAPRGVFALIAPLMGPVIRRQNAAAAVRLRRALEAGDQPTVEQPA
jgi:hypothetical protein